MTHLQRRMHTITLRVCAVIAVASCVTVVGTAHINQGEVTGALYGGANKYHGEFSDDMFGLATGVGVTYALLDRLWIEGRFGLGEYRWKITEAKLQRFPGYFGTGSEIGDRYPGTLTTIEAENESRATSVDVMASWVVVPHIAASPFVSVGLGLFNFAPSNSVEHSALPNNLRGIYPRTVVSIPVGGGVHIPISSALGLILRAEHRFVFSTYLDDVRGDHGNDALTSFTLGLSYNFSAARSPRESQVTDVHEVVQEIHAVPFKTSCHHCGCVLLSMHGCCCHHGMIGTQQPAGPREQSAPAPAVVPAPVPEAGASTPPEPAPTSSPTAEPSATTPKKRTSFSKDIRFVVDTDEFDTSQPETEQNLQELLAYMQESCDELEVMIEGHASADGPPARNRELSKLRAQKVQQWLIDQGVAPSKIRGTMGFGSSMPRVVEPSPAVARTMSKDELEAIRRQNRRIEIAVLRECKVQ